MGGLRRIPVSAIYLHLELDGVPADEWLELAELMQLVDAEFCADINREEEPPAPAPPSRATEGIGRE